MRETSWDKRLPTHEHERQFAQILSLHELTLAWLDAIQADLPSHGATHKMARGLQAKALENFRRIDLLDSLSRDRSRESSSPDAKTGSAGARGLAPFLAPFMDDTRPEDVVQRLEYGVWVTQAHTLRHILDSVPAGEHPALRNVLEQASWKIGRARAEARWPDFPDDLRLDLRGLFRAAADAPFMGASQPGGILLERALKLRVTVRYPFCAHRSRFAEVRPVADELCELHAHWLRGFAYALQPRTRVLARVESEGCLHHWEAVNTN